jgi:hypothetical protein
LFLPQTNTRPFSRRADEFDPCFFEDALEFEERLGAAGWDIVVLLKPLNSVTGYTCSFGQIRSSPAQ